MEMHNLSTLPCFRDNEGRLELDFESDPTDIIYSEHGLLDRSSMVRPTRDAEDSEQIQSLKVSKTHHSTYKCITQIQSSNLHLIYFKDKSRQIIVRKLRTHFSTIGLLNKFQ